MIVENGKYYLYRYIRLDKNEPFYIGIGTKAFKKRGFLSYKSEYSRAFHPHKGSIFDKIINKTSYTIEILLESDNLEFIKQKEIDFIALYGRKCTKDGILSNLSTGGEGNKGSSYSEEVKIRMRDQKKCRKVVKIDTNYNVLETYISGLDAVRKTGIKCIHHICRLKCKCKEGITYRYLNELDSLKTIKLKNKSPRTYIRKYKYKIIDTINNLELEFKDCKQISKYLNIEYETCLYRTKNNVIRNGIIILRKINWRN